MFEISTVLLFISSAILRALSPGADNVFVLTVSIARGRWQAFNLFRAPAEELISSSSRESYKPLYLCGVVMNIMNPKVSLFFLAFLVFGLINLAAGRIGCFQRKGNGAQKLNRLSDVVFAGLAVKLLLSER
jgi:threonine/homoserine/homoserine lactone efflux protein